MTKKQWNLQQTLQRVDYRIAGFFVGSKIRSLTVQNEYFPARPARVRRGVVHVRAQETKIKLSEIRIFAQNEKLTERKKRYTVLHIQWKNCSSPACTLSIIQTPCPQCAVCVYNLPF